MNMSTKSEVLADYAQAMAELRAEAERLGMTSSEMEELLSSSLDVVIDKPPRERRLWSLLTVVCWILKALLVASLLYAIVACHSPTQKTLSRHIQGYIYPFMRGLRKLTLPILRAYPDLTEWHEEPCLIRNPFFGLRGPDCWPCDSVRSVLVLDESPINFVETYYHNGQPFVIQGNGEDSTHVTWSELQLLQKNNALLHQSAPKVMAESFSSSSIPLAELLSIPERNVSELYPNAHLTWKITRSDAARVLRQLFPRPQFVPTHTEVAIQRFVFIDSPLAPSYALPLTDFANVWISQGSGARLLALIPSPHCSQRCHPISVLLQPGDLRIVILSR